MAVLRLIRGSLLLALLGGCASPVRLLEAPRALQPGAAVILTVELHVWDRFGRQSLPLPNASQAAAAGARQALARHLPVPRCRPPTPDPVLDAALALYRQVASAWLSDPAAGRAGLGIGAGLAPLAGGCATGLILLGQQLPQPARASNWLSLGAIDVADGRLLRLAALPLAPTDDLRRPELLDQAIGRLVERLYR